jgi:magnesium transporter
VRVAAAIERIRILVEVTPVKRRNKKDQGVSPRTKRSRARLGEKRSRKLGLPPGTLVHIGEKKADKTFITIRDYDETRLSELKTDRVDACIPYRNAPTVTWVNVEGIHEVENVEQLGTCFGIHPLVLEDVVNTGQRSKLEDFEEYLFLVLRKVSDHEPESGIDYEQLSVILGRHFVLTFQEAESRVFSPIIERLGNEKSRARRMGADYLAYALLDLVVDSYFLVLERIGDRIEVMEDEVVASPTQGTFREIQDLKRELILLRRAVWPLRDLLGGLVRGDSPLIQESTRLYFRDVYDHTIQIIETMDTFRDMLSGFVDIYLSSVSNRMNAVMKVLTIIATIFMPMTFIAGVYGMNFEHMPELAWRWAYPASLGLMGLVALAMLWYFVRKGWLGRETDRAEP